MMRQDVLIRFTDIDMFGHVNNAIYSQWFDTARFTFLKSILPQIEPKGRSLVMVHIETDFLQQLVFGDKVYVESFVSKVGNRSLGIGQRVVNEATGKVHAVSYGVLSTFDASVQKSFDMPQEWREILLKHLETQEC